MVNFIEGKSYRVFWIAHRESDGMLTSHCVQKTLHTNGYLHFKSHHPHQVKRGIVRCLYQRARRITNMSENLKEEKKHLH